MLRAWCILVILFVTSTGCGRNLYHYHRTVVGVDISGNVAGDTPSGHLTLGYSRRLVIVMPPEIQKAMEGRTPSGNIPPTVFCTQVKASLGGVNSFREILATGEPADGYAQQLAASATAARDDKIRNYVCPGLVIPEATAGAGEQGTKSPAKALAP